MGNQIEYLHGNLFAGSSGAAPVDLAANAGADINPGDRPARLTPSFRLAAREKFR